MYIQRRTQNVIASGGRGGACALIFQSVANDTVRPSVRPLNNNSNSHEMKYNIMTRRPISRGHRYQIPHPSVARDLPLQKRKNSPSSISFVVVVIPRPLTFGHPPRELTALLHARMTTYNNLLYSSCFYINILLSTCRRVWTFYSNSIPPFRLLR